MARKIFKADEAEAKYIENSSAANSSRMMPCSSHRN